MTAGLTPGLSSRHDLTWAALCPTSRAARQYATLAAAAGWGYCWLLAGARTQLRADTFFAQQYLTAASPLAPGVAACRRVSGRATCPKSRTPPWIDYARKPPGWACQRCSEYTPSRGSPSSRWTGGAAWVARRTAPAACSLANLARPSLTPKQRRFASMASLPMQRPRVGAAARGPVHYFAPCGSSIWS